MWNPTEIKLKYGSLDFSSAGIGAVDAKKIYLDEWKFCNSVDHVEIDEDALVQFYVCPHCGYVSCEPGNWLSLRRSGDFVFFIPAFEDMEEDESDLAEYSPPYEVKKRGAFYLDRMQYDQLKRYMGMLPRQEDLPTLSKREVSLLVQWEAPFQVLGNFPNGMSLEQQDYLVVDGGEDKDVLETLKDALSHFYSSRNPADTPIEVENKSTILLGAYDFAKWSPISIVGGRVFLRLEPAFCFET